MRLKIALFGPVVCATTVLVGAQTRPNVQPKDGYVPNAETAVTIGVAVLGPIYGEANVARHRPYNAKLTAGTWTVRGTLPPGTTGGICRRRDSPNDDGRVIRVFHEQ